MFKISAFADEAAKCLVEQVNALKKNSLHLIELRTINGVNIADITQEQAKEYACYLQNEGISLSAIGSPIGKVNLKDIETHIDKAKKLFEFCNIFGTDRMRIFSFYYDVRDCNRSWVCDCLHTLCYIAKSYGVNLYLENEKDVMGDTAENCKEILDNVTELNFVFDPANFIQCNERVLKALNLLKDRISYLHIKDISETTGEIVPAGKGDAKISELINFMDAKPGVTVLTVEPHLSHFEGYETLDKHKLINKYTFTSANEAFDCAVNALKKIMYDLNFKETNGIWKR